jgi:hypothetical protein
MMHGAVPANTGAFRSVVGEAGLVEPAPDRERSPHRTTPWALCCGEELSPESYIYLHIIRGNGRTIRTDTNITIDAGFKCV